MRRRAERALWTTALVGSLALHAVLGTALALAPTNRETPRAETLFTIHSAPGVVTEPAREILAVPTVEQGRVAIAAKDLTRPAEVTSTSAEARSVAGAADAAQHMDPLPAPVTRHEDRPGLVAPMDAVVDPVASAVASARVETGSDPVAPVRDASAMSPLNSAVTSVSALQSTAIESSSTVPASAVSAPAASVARNSAATVATAAPAAPASLIAPSVTTGEAAVTANAARSIPFAVNSPMRTLEPERPVVSPVVPQGSQTVLAVRPESVLEPRENPQDVLARVQSVLASERGSFGDCFLALPTIVGEGVEVDGFSVSAGSIDRLASRLGADAATPVEIRRNLVSGTQCAALSFAASLSDDPSMRVDLSALAIPSGGELVGEVRRISRNWFYLLTVDGDGKVQEVNSGHMSEVGQGTVRFNAPLTLTGSPGDTVQLLVAVASDQILETVWLREGADAATYFRQLSDEIDTNGVVADIALAPFLVRQP